MVPTDAAKWMGLAIMEAKKAGELGEVPVGAVVVARGKVVARAHNETIRAHDPTAHAEILALRRAGRRLGLHRLTDAVIYVTLEPCAMCVGAMIQARVVSLAFGCRDPKAGAVVSLFQLASDARLNHRFTFEEGILEGDCRDLLSGFFRARRAERRARRVN